MTHKEQRFKRECERMTDTRKERCVGGAKNKDCFRISNLFVISLMVATEKYSIYITYIYIYMNINVIRRNLRNPKGNN